MNSKRIGMGYAALVVAVAMFSAQALAAPVKVLRDRLFIDLLYQPGVILY